MKLKLNDRYRLVYHPYSPTGTITKISQGGTKIRITWDDTTFIPPYNDYDAEMFMDGSFVLVKEDEVDSSCECTHCWKKYVGLREAYEYCEWCPATRALVE